MSTQHTTLPPLPESIARLVRDIHNAIGELAGCTRYPDLTEAIDELAAIAAQAPADEPDMHAYATGLERSTFQMKARIEALDFEIRSLKAQQAQGVPAPTVLSVPENCKNRLFDPTVGDACIFDAGGGWPYQVEDAKKKLTLEAEYKVTKVEAHSSHTRIWIEGREDWFNSMLFRALAAAPQAEPQPEREPTRLETLHAWATSGEPPCNSFDKGYEAAREFVAMQLAGIGTKGGDK